MPDPHDIEPVPPCRVLVRNGIALEDPEIVTERPRLAENFKRTDITPAPTSPYVPHGETIHGRASQPRVGRPRVRQPKAHPYAGRGKAWNRKDAVTDEQILALRAQGLSYQKIGQALGIDPSTAHHRLNRRGQKAASA
jgi:hypothetical protein